MVDDITIPLIMVCISGVIGLLGVWVGHNTIGETKRQEALDAFWHKYAVTDGVEPVLHYLGNLSARLEWMMAVSRRASKYGAEDLAASPVAHAASALPAVPMPYSAFHRIAQLTGLGDFTSIALHGELLLEGMADEMDIVPVHKEVTRVVEFIGRLDEAFSCADIKRKYDITVVKNQAKMKASVNELNKSLEAIRSEGKRKPEPRVEIKAKR